MQRRSLSGLAAVAAAISSPAAQGQALEAPPAISGWWISSCRSGPPARLKFEAGGAMIHVGGQFVRCRLTGRRDLHPKRWYLDYDCSDLMLMIDVNQLGPGQILVAERPLGEACAYSRGHKAPSDE